MAKTGRETSALLLNEHSHCRGSYSKHNRTTQKLKDLERGLLKHSPADHHHRLFYRHGFKLTVRGRGDKNNRLINNLAEHTTV